MSVELNAKIKAMAEEVVEALDAKTTAEVEKNVYLRLAKNQIKAVEELDALEEELETKEVRLESLPVGSSHHADLLENVERLRNNIASKKKALPKKNNSFTEARLAYNRGLMTEQLLAENNRVEARKEESLAKTRAEGAKLESTVEKKWTSLFKFKKNNSGRAFFACAKKATQEALDMKTINRTASGMVEVKTISGLTVQLDLSFDDHIVKVEAKAA